LPLGKNVGLCRLAQSRLVLLTNCYRQPRLLSCRTRANHKDSCPELFESDVASHLKMCTISCVEQCCMFAPNVNARRQDARKPSRAELESMVQERTKALRSLSVHLLQMQDEERRRIA